MTKRKDPAVGRAQTLHTIDSLMDRCVEVGECMEWQGYITNGVPQVSHGGKIMAVRRLMLELRGDPLGKGWYAACSCGNKACVVHIAKRSSKQHLKKMANTPSKNEAARVAKLVVHARKRAKLSIDAVREVRLSDEPSQALADRHGVCRQVISRIRSGVSWKEASSPFAGLGARA